MSSEALISGWLPSTQFDLTCLATVSTPELTPSSSTTVGSREPSLGPDTPLHSVSETLVPAKVTIDDRGGFSPDWSQFAEIRELRLDLGMSVPDNANGRAQGIAAGAVEGIPFAKDGGLEGLGLDYWAHVMDSIIETEAWSAIGGLDNSLDLDPLEIKYESEP
jgi:hypothetical protein